MPTEPIVDWQFNQPSSSLAASVGYFAAEVVLTQRRYPPIVDPGSTSKNT